MFENILTYFEVWELQLITQLDSINLQASILPMASCTHLCKNFGFIFDLELGSILDGGCCAHKLKFSDHSLRIKSLHSQEV